MVNQQDTDPKNRPKITNLSTEIAQLRQELEQQKSDFQTMEVSLVSRIADVDDDRRHAATRLQRTHQNHRDEIDMRLRRQNAIVTTTLILFVIIVGVLLVFVYAKFDQARQTFSDEIGELRQTLEEVKASASVPPVQTQDPATREKLSQLSTAVKAITTSLERLAEDQESLPTVEPQPRDLQFDPSVEPQQIESPSPTPPQPSAPSAPRSPERDIDAEPVEKEKPEPTATPSQEPRSETDGVTKVEPQETEETSSPLQTRSPIAEEAPEPSQESAATPEVPAPPSSPPESQPPLQETAAVREMPESSPEPTADPEDSDASLEPPPVPAIPESADEPTAPPEAAEPLREPAQAPEASTTEEPSSSEPAVHKEPEPTTPQTESAPDEPTRIPVGDTPYSVQVIGFYSLQSLKTFAKRYGLTDWVVYDEETYQGRTWYVLIDSLHATRESAEAAAAALSPALAKFDIWVRKLDPDDTVYHPESGGD
ncbi:SPOR domain-containing protein [Imhoffiella purpurea]|nr:hypothetical protein [Imhoffiella purpurea]